MHTLVQVAIALNCLCKPCPMAEQVLVTHGVVDLYLLFNIYCYLLFIIIIDSKIIL